jgi:hypothetical protein
MNKTPVLNLSTGVFLCLFDSFVIDSLSFSIIVI